jgi:hypothetical protein
LFAFLFFSFLKPPYRYDGKFSPIVIGYRRRQFHHRFFFSWKEFFLRTYMPMSSDILFSSIEKLHGARLWGKFLGKVTLVFWFVLKYLSRRWYRTSFFKVGARFSHNPMDRYYS